VEQLAVQDRRAGRAADRVVDEGLEAQAEERVFWADYEKQAMDKARAGGVQIVETIDKQPFQDAVKPVWDKYGPRFSELIKRIQAVS